MDERTIKYVKSFAPLIKAETVSEFDQEDRSKFYAFRELLKSTFPHIFAACTLEDYNGSFLMKWQGAGGDEPILLMNHHDVVEATGSWSHGPFESETADGKIWGRGTLDTKGGLWAMLQAADELAEEGYVPKRDVYFESACTEECDGSGAETISKELEKRGVHFYMVLDEGGYIMDCPVLGAKGDFAMIGVGEKGAADLKIIARGAGGHASRPGKNTPLVRLGKFMAAADRKNLFKAELSPTVAELFSRSSGTMKKPFAYFMKNAAKYAFFLKPILCKASPTMRAMLKTTMAFTMAQGSGGTNVIPQEAWIIGNMRFSHHQGRDSSVREVKRLARRFKLDIEILDPGFSSPISDHTKEPFNLVERGIKSVFGDVPTAPYIMMGASDSRYMGKVCENCLRFLPFRVTAEQYATIHGVDENLDIDALAPAVDFYKFIIKEA